MRGLRRRPLYLFLFLMSGLVPLKAAEQDVPVYVTQIQNPNDYALFANGGWDGNWYVGWNNGWVKRLPPIPSGRYARAYIGAKLGRMKTLPPEGRPPKFNPISGEIWMAIASTPSWSADQKMRLTSTEDIPLESSAEYALENTGEAEWFWTEIPLANVTMTGDNYLAIWSTSTALVSVSSAPVLAAGWGGKEINAWVAKDLKGEPPANSRGALSTPVSYFQPALALKLIPVGDSHPMQVRILSWHNGTADHLRPILFSSVKGESIERVWIECSEHVRHGDVVQGQWKQVGRSLWKAPYVFSLNQEQLSHGRIYIRVAATNIWEEKATSDPIEIDVSPIHAQK